MRRLALEGETEDHALTHLLRHRLGPRVDGLCEHPVLPAWLFEETTAALVRPARADPRLGVEPHPKRRARRRA